MKKYCAVLLMLTLLGGCAKTPETAALDDSDLPWGRPADWEKDNYHVSLQLKLPSQEVTITKENK